MGTGQKEVLFNAAENVGQLDLNNMQRFLRAVMADWQYGQGGSFQGSGDVGAAGFDRTKAPYVLGDSGAPYPHPVNAIATQNLAGPIGQWKTGPTFPLSANGPATNWGTDPYFLVYWLSPDELATTHAAPDPTNPRWDLVCVRLNDVSNDVADQETRLQKQVVGSDFVISSDDFIKRRKVTITKQVVQGTPAGSPAMPSVPSGFVPYYAALVPAGTAGPFAVDNNFHDYRMPLGSFAVDVSAVPSVLGQFGAVSGNIAILTGPTSAIRWTGGGAVDVDLITSLPLSPHSCRLIGVAALEQRSTAFSTVKLGRYNPVVSGGVLGVFNAVGGNATWTIANLAGGTPPTTNNDSRWYTERLSGQAGNSPPTASIKPPWGTGWPSGYASRAERTAGLDNATDAIGLRFTSSTADVALIKARFYFAGMPY